MANTDAPFGLRALRHSAGGVIRTSEYEIADGYNTAIYTGDPVKSTGTGRNIAIGVAAGNLLGVFAGCSYTTLAGEVVYSKHWPASTALKTGSKAKAYVYDDPNIEFLAQGLSIAEADINLFADLVVGAGSAATGMAVGYVGGHASTEAQVKILGLEPMVNNAYGAYAKIRVLIMAHENRGAGVEV